MKNIKLEELRRTNGKPGREKFPSHQWQIQKEKMERGGGASNPEPETTNGNPDEETLATVKRKASNSEQESDNGNPDVGTLATAEREDS